MTLLDAGAAAQNGARIEAACPGRATARAAAAEIRRAHSPGGREFFWLSDGIEDGQGKSLRDALPKAWRSSAIFAPDQRTALGLLPPRRDASGFAVTAIRAHAGNRALAIQVARHRRQRRDIERRHAPLSSRGQDSRRRAYRLADGSAQRRPRGLQIPDEDSAGAVQLLDSGWQSSGASARVGGGVRRRSHFCRTSIIWNARWRLSPKWRRAPSAGLIAQHVSVLFLADVGKITRQRCRRGGKISLSNGGVLIRFAGPRMTGGTDDLVPVQFAGRRALSGQRDGLEPAPASGAFPLASPVQRPGQSPNEVTVSRQILAEPGAELSGPHLGAAGGRHATGHRARQEAQGWIVLFHITASPAWSSLPLSGLYVDMLKRLLALSAGTPAARSGACCPACRPCQRAGWLRPCPSRHRADVAAHRRAGFRSHTACRPQHPPGLYGAQGVASALNVTATRMTALTPLGDVPACRPMATPTLALEPYLLALAAILLLLDCLVSLWLRGYHPATGWLGAAARAVCSCCCVPIPHARADDAMNMKAALDTRLAYVITGLPDVDAMSKAGLTGLGLGLESAHVLRAAGADGRGSSRMTICPSIPCSIGRWTRARRISRPRRCPKITDYMRTGRHHPVRHPRPDAWARCAATHRPANRPCGG